MSLDKRFDSASSLITLLFAAMPEFVIGLWLVVIFATTVFPGALPSITQIPPGGRPWDDMTAMILPTTTLVLAVTPYHGIALVLVFAAVLWLFRYVSLASMVMAFVLVYRVRENAAFELTLLGALCLFLASLLWLVLVIPINFELYNASWTQ